MLINTPGLAFVFFLFIFAIYNLKYCVRISYLINIVFAIIILFPSHGMAKKRKNPFPDKPELADSILNNVMFFAPFYNKIVDDYKGELYVKGKMNIIKRNHLLRFVPSMFRPEKKVREYMVEAMNDIHYTAPDIYDLKVKAISGTISRNKGISSEMLSYFNMNIYSSTLLPDKLLSPLANNGRKHYFYLLDSVIGSNEHRKYRILIVPKNKSSQLVNGYMIVSDQLWTVREIYLEGEYEFTRFKVKIVMGEEGDEEFLPKKFDVDVFFRFVGNKIDGSYSAYFKYDEIRLSDINRRNIRKKNKYDMTESFKLTCDSTLFLTDSAQFATLRPIPLDEHEKMIYQDYDLRRDTTMKNFKPKTRSQIFMGQMGDVLIRNYTVNLAQMGNVRFSPLINPFLVSYSPSNGFSYRQDFKYNCLLPGDRWLRVVPKFGYNFTRKEFYWSVNGDFDYWPRKRASIHMSFGNGNRIYSSDVLDDIKNIPDSLFNFDELPLTYFKDLYYTLNHKIEVLNGLSISAGFTTHRRTPVKKIELITDKEHTLEQIEILPQFPSEYISFAPRVRIEWTPGLYYYMSGYRKVNLHSRYPTFSLDWERGLKGVFKSTGKYERLEFDMQHQIRLGPMRSIYYRAGMGAFTNQEQLYFVDFANFSRNNLPVGWNDDIGGVFQLLDGRWYNSSHQYLRGHFTYESPFLFWPHLIKYTNFIENERLYLSVLFVPHLTPYVEVGYGIGTHIFDVGVFVGSVNGKFSDFGCKFTFELFNK